MTASTSAIGVVGGGTMGVGIAYVFAAAGWRTTVVEPNPQRAHDMSVILGTAAEQGITRGKLSKAQASAITHSVERVGSIAELANGLNLVVESVPEKMDLKLAVLGEIEQRRPQLIATNTSALSVDALSGAIGDRHRFFGMHFFNPVWSLPLVEIIRGASTSDDTIAEAVRIATEIGKQTVTVRDTPGFATSRLDLIASLEAMRMLEDGVATAEDIDRAMVVAYRHPIGPLRLSDIVGLDVRLDIARHLGVALGDRYRPPRILEDMVAAGRLGQKSGRGFFEWPEVGEAIP